MLILVVGWEKWENVVLATGHHFCMLSAHIHLTLFRRSLANAGGEALGNQRKTVYLSTPIVVLQNMVVIHFVYPKEDQACVLHRTTIKCGK